MSGVISMLSFAGFVGLLFSVPGSLFFLGVVLIWLWTDGDGASAEHDPGRAV